MKTNDSMREKFKQEVADAFVACLNEPDKDWHKAWLDNRYSSPYNGISNRNYQNTNAMLLSLVSHLKEYNDPRWFTFVQICDKDNQYHPDQKWHLKEGSKGTLVEFWYPYNVTEKRSMTWEEYNHSRLHQTGNLEDEHEKIIILPVYHHVFNATQIDGVPPIEIKQNDTIKVENLIERLSDELGVDISYDGGNRAYYRHTDDSIHLPEPKCFESQAYFNSTAMHEIAHSTGHSSRLNRKLSNYFGSEEYAYEELIAEISATMMAVNFEDYQIDLESSFDNNIAYVQSWSKSIKEKPDFLFEAIKEAQRAANYMEDKLGIKKELAIDISQQNYQDALPEEEIAIRIYTLQATENHYEEIDYLELREATINKIKHDLEKKSVGTYLNAMKDIKHSTVNVDSRKEASFLEKQLILVVNKKDDNKKAIKLKL